MFCALCPGFRPKVACYKKVFANVKELQQELKAHLRVRCDVRDNDQTATTQSHLERLPPACPPATGFGGERHGQPVRASDMDCSRLDCKMDKHICRASINSMILCGSGGLKELDLSRSKRDMVRTGKCNHKANLNYSTDPESLPPACPPDCDHLRKSQGILQHTLRALEWATRKISCLFRLGD